MSDAPDNLVLELLRAIRAENARTNEILTEHGHRLARIEIGMAGLRRDQASDAEAVALMGLRFDRVDERLDRIERRLGLIEA
ncbi:hypothetical protein [Acidisoma silvae]|uniref:Uncharacterized protein n=1 Tax=Acidisoma silvae TaxID=2802396 RepID=A0A964DXT1_9PROT|nr:hypothetical protein [Acidisoma silvae]MCB8874214.1 hypothetical protein [Acidisoma silvae]